MMHILHSAERHLCNVPTDHSKISTKSVQKQINALPNLVRDRIDTVIRLLVDDARPDGVVKLKGSDSAYRIRVGDYRIVYEVNDEQLVILLVQCKHRREVYRSR